MSQVQEQMLAEEILGIPSSGQLAVAMSGSHLGALLALARLQAPSFPISILRHAASFSAQDKQKVLPAGVVVQKSLTLAVGEHLVLLSGLGDFHVERTAHLRALARCFLLRGRDARRYDINPASFSSQFVAGLAPEMVSPFLPPERVRRFPLSAVVILPSPEEVPSTALVAISLSLSTSLLYPVARLPALLEAYGLRYYPQIPLVFFPGAAGRTGKRADHAGCCSVA